MNNARRATMPLLAAIIVAQSTLAQTPPTPPRPALPAAPASRAATTPAVDRSAPDKTWSALCASVKAGDLPAFRACCYNKNEVSSLFMDAYSDTIVTSFQLAAAVAQLGAEGQTLSKTLESNYTDLVKSGENRVAQITGDSARWSRTVASGNVTAQEAMFFKKVGPDWLLDTEQSYNLASAEGRKTAEDFIASAGPTLKALKTVIADIQSKKITTVQQMRDRLAKGP
jgi:hypothetical protein